MKKLQRQNTKIIYIEGDIPIEMSDEEFEDVFSEDQIKDLESGESIMWIDEDGVDHIVNLIN